ncbi:DNA polymerase III subunit gamma and tau [Microbacterium sp. C7(2022)]|uniref:DNA polymerase III subunit gamma and tau n=1 Tax=Microbacterium sp. C7(2022) TaxID=2992759 RepID=UPI00237BD98C|nr:DNA polymerase III subunit gamma and tau [Microbacterium sp. C7(2022)]MDE0546027.1 DNA polymerase III subunit gamma and tau [Microbacterium sp. C7(2022)]
MTTALYRRYRPEAFGEMIGQSQVTDPLMTALRGDRVGHAYLFSGPRGCGKTTSARILARCLNCAEGPTDTPCGTCDSCVELGRGGGGSLDVVEIDAASHNGVDDARDLRERAVFAPARDRFKIFILDEAHMVTPQGFNALLKLVEEPPAHVKFIFATTEPEKVIGTIRSRTHHYPFRLVPPAAMLEYVEHLCAEEEVDVEPGVLPLVVRAGGGSPRDTLSLLDQLIAGSEHVDGAEDGEVLVAYERAVALLGYTHAELLDEVVDAFAAQDAAAAFAAVDRVVQTGQDPRRFVDDLLERLRDLIVVAATGSDASAVLRGVSTEDLARMQTQADAMGTARLSRTADLVIATLDDMTGATSPRLQLELMVARVLTYGAAPQLSVPAEAPASAQAPADAPQSPAAAAPANSAQQTAVPVHSAPAAAPPRMPANEVAAPAHSAPAPSAQASSAQAPGASPTVSSASPAVAAPAAQAPTGPVTLERMRAAWPQILGALENMSRTSWLVVSNAQVAELADDVLTLTFASTSDIDKFKKLNAGKGPSEDLRQAIIGVVGLRVKYLAKPAGSMPTSAAHQGAGRAPSAPAPASGSTSRAPSGSSDPDPGAGPRESIVRGTATVPRSADPVTEWAVAPIPSDDDAPPPDPGPAAFAAPPAQFAVDDEPEDIPARTVVPPPAAARDDDEDDELATDVPPDAQVPPVVAPPIIPTVTSRNDGVQRYGEAVVRQVLGATFVREEPYESPTRFN